MALSSFSGVASGAEFPLVPGARWVVSAESVERVDRELVPLLRRAGRRASVVSAASQARDREEAWGLPVLDRERWVQAGLDPAQGWTVFADGEGTWLAAGVLDASKVAAWLDRWARLRGLHRRDDVALGRGLSAATYARAKGSRPAAARVVSRERVLVLASSDVRTPGLARAFAAVENAVPAATRVDGVVRGWMRRSAARDVWWSVRPQSDGVDVDARVGGVVAGWVSVEPARAAWISSALDARGAAFRGRATVGPEWAWLAAEGLADGWGVGGPAATSWMAALQPLATGAVEVAGERVFPERAAMRNGRVEWARVFPAWFVLPGRDAGAVASFVEASAALLGGRATTRGEEVAKGWRGRVEGDGTTLRLAIGDGAPLGPVAGRTASPFGDPCAQGHPVAAGVVDGPALARAFDGVTLLGALRDESVLAAWAVGAELGPLLRVSEPLAAVACASDPSTVDVRVRWRFRD